MSKSQKQRDRLIELLKELFQLNQPDLDFGFYRIMHAKADKVSSFLENDLLKIVSDAFGEADEAKLNDAKLAIEKAKEDAIENGAPDPENTPKVLKAKEAYEQIKDAGNGETEIYDHLYRFFERYYDDGDFLSRRYYARETDGKAAAYSIPYDGREVYLHWANRDQYYIKTSEYLTNFTFNLNNAPELPEIFKGIERKIHCRIIDAAEGEHGNVKTSAANERYFIIDANEPIKFEGNDLIIQFQYRPDADKTGQGNIWQSKRIDEAEKTIFAALEECDQKELLASLQTKIGEKQDRTLLRKYLNQYSSRNTMDYFIHKDLGGFLNRELDFYIKNEIMRLDDIETADAPKVEFFLTKIKILRKIAKSLIEFLAQLEEFQKKIWLKKKFVVETNYCITLDKIPEELYYAIIANAAQHDEWVKLFAINDIKGDLGGGVDYSNPLSIEFLKANPFLVLDTAFFDEDFKSQVLAKIENLDEASGGLLIHSENFQALSLMRTKAEANFDCVYLDPPYNTDATPIAYKNNYKSSSWLSLINNRLESTFDLMKQEKHGICLAIDDAEVSNLSQLLANIDSNYELHKTIVNHYPGSGTGRSNVTRTHEYALFLIPKGEDLLRGAAKEDGVRERGFRRAGTGENNYRTGRENSFFAILVDPVNHKVVGAEPPPPLGKEYPAGDTPEGYKRIYPIGEDFSERVWSLSYDGFLSAFSNNMIRCTKSFAIIRLYNDLGERNLLQSLWVDKRYNAVTHGTNLLKDILGSGNLFSYPKSINTVADAIEAMTHHNQSSLVLDYFAGSGTSAHAILDMNRADLGNRKYNLIEMADYFDSVTKVRTQKAIYSKFWKNGNPLGLCDKLEDLRKEIAEKNKQLREISGILDKVDYEFKRQLITGQISELESQLNIFKLKSSEQKNRFFGISHIFKYIRLETYEDALNNLHFKTDENREKALAKNDDFRREYMLKYWLEFETKNSPSLLNITQFADPMEYKLSVKKPSSDEYIEKNVDLIETFNWLIGLWVDHIDIPRTFDANFKREIDPELPKDQKTRLLVDGKITEAQNGKYWFRKIEGKICRTPGDKTNMDKVLVIWRKLTGNLEEDNAVLEAWFEKMRINPNDNEFDIIYINGSNPLPNEKMRLIEEAFHNKMWDVEN